MELSGKIKVIFETKAVSASFRKRELVLETDGRYPQQILVEFTQDKIELLDRVKAGDEVTIGIDIRGREWTSPRGETKYFVSIVGWRIGPAGQSGGQGGGQGGGQDGGGYGGGGPRKSGGEGGAPGSEPPFDDAPIPDGPDGGGDFRDDDIPF